MRHIQLNEERSCPFETVMQFGCGPHFLFNRRDEFELMIYEQGFTFWFRFWLCFCGHAISNAHNDGLNTTIHNLTDVRKSVLINIHKQFLQGSIEEAIHYCLYKAVMHLVSPSMESIVQEGKEKDVATVKQQFHNLVQECSDMAFGAALCEIFYKWMHAKTIDNDNQEYWTIPAKYMEKNFKPGVIENFLTNTWGKYLVVLIGTSLSHIPDWLLYADNNVPDDILNYNEWLENITLEFIKKMVKTLTHRRNFWRQKIDFTDEQLKENQIFTASAETDSGTNISKYTLSLDSLTAKEHSQNKCSFCKKIQINDNPNPCEHCLTAEWYDVRFYCSDKCKLEHLFLEHSREHFGLNIPEVILKTSPIKS